MTDSKVSNVDARLKNMYFDATSITHYAKSYAAELEKTLSNLDPVALEKLLGLLDLARTNRRVVWVAGNGGSFAIAEHLCCDWTKGLQHSEKPHLKVHSLGSNGPLVTAIANDLSFADVFSEQIKMFCESGDVLVLISSSGNSSNVCQAAEVARALGLTIASFTGFTGGRLREISDVNIHVPFSNYGIVEDVHQAVMHILAQYSYLKDIK